MKVRSYTTWPVWIAAGVAVVFGAMTILSGGLVLFGGAAAQTAAGDAVAFVLWFNFLSGFIYILAGAGIAAAEAIPSVAAVRVEIAARCI